MSFKLENFIAAPSMELLNLAKKTDLLNIADHYTLTSVKPSKLKHEIKNLLIKFFVDEEILDPSALSSILITQTDLQLRELSPATDSPGKIKIRTGRKRVEQLEREERIQKEKLEMEEREKEKERQIQRERLEMEERVLKEKLEQEEKEKERQYNLRMKELEMNWKCKIR